MRAVIALLIIALICSSNAALETFAMLLAEILFVGPLDDCICSAAGSLDDRACCATVPGCEVFSEIVTNLIFQIRP